MKNLILLLVLLASCVLTTSCTEAEASIQLEQDLKKTTFTLWSKNSDTMTVVRDWKYKDGSILWYDSSVYDVSTSTMLRLYTTSIDNRPR